MLYSCKNAFLKILRTQLPWDAFVVKADTKRERNALVKAFEANFKCLEKS